jgi:hypothetical protein
MDADIILQRGEACHDKPDWMRREPCIMSLSVIRGIERKEIVKDDHDGWFFDRWLQPGYSLVAGLDYFDPF